MARYRRLLLALLAALSLVAITAACGGGDDDDGDATATTGGEATATPAGGDANAATATATEEGGSSDDSDSDTTATADDSSGAGLERVRAAAATIGQQTFHVVFDVESESMAGAFTLTSVPPNSLVGMDGTIDGTAGSYLIVTLDDFLYFCSDSDGQQACIKTKAGQSIPIQLPTLMDAGDVASRLANAPGMSIEQVEGETIAGIDADCYEFSSPNEAGKVCIGEDMLLSYDGTYEGDPVSMRASEYTADAADIEIAVPDWPITDLSGLGN